MPKTAQDRTALTRRVRRAEGAAAGPRPRVGLRRQRVPHRVRRARLLLPLRRVLRRRGGAARRGHEQGVQRAAGLPRQ